MNHPSTPFEPHKAGSDPASADHVPQSLRRASILFVASLGSFIGASLLLASL
jgi:hypothetical protein